MSWPTDMTPKTWPFESKTLYLSSSFWLEKTRISKWSWKLFSIHFHVQMIILCWYRTIWCLSFSYMNKYKLFANTHTMINFFVLHRQGKMLKYVEKNCITNIRTDPSSCSPSPTWSLLGSIKQNTSTFGRNTP